MADTVTEAKVDGTADDIDKKLNASAASSDEEDSAASSGSDDDSDSGDDSDNSNSSGGSASSAEEEKKGEDGDENAEEDDFTGFRRKRGKKKLRARAQRRAAAAAGKDPNSAVTSEKEKVGTKRKRAKKTASKGEDIISRYMDLEVEEADEGEEDEGERAWKRAKSDEAAATQAVIERVRREAEEVRRRRETAKTAEQIAEEIARREKETGYGERDDYDEFAVDAAAAGMLQQANLPDAKDPKLWMLRCKPGAETEILISLCNKYIALNDTHEKLSIMSAVSTTKGVVFVEAHREAQVRAAVSNIRDLYGWKPDAIQLVPIREMTNVLNVAAKRHVFKKNEYVRMSTGAYKGDLAQVLDVYEGGSRLLIRCIPRINYSLLSLPKDQRKGFRGQSRSQRPPQRLFDRDAIMDASNGTATIESRRKYGGMLVDVFASNTYKDGMLIKEVKPGAVNPHGPPPTMDEVAKFRPQRKGDDDDVSAARSAETAAMESLSLAKVLAASSDDSSKLLPGDSVVVVKGDLTNVTGKVVAVNGATFTMKPTGTIAMDLGMHDAMEMPTDEVIKTFEPGDRVKLLDGTHLGETGVVVKMRHKDIEGSDQSSAWMAVVLLDAGYKQVEAAVKNLTRTAEVRAAIQEVEGYVLYDLVEIPGAADQNDACVIVGLGHRDVTVLQATGNVKTVPVQQLRGKINYRSSEATAVDSMSNTLTVGDVVKVQLHGEPMPTTGTIKHIYRGTLFLHDFKRPANAGMFTARSRACTLAGTKVRVPGTIQASNPEPMRHGGGGGGPRGRNEDSLAGKTVRIASGPQKGKIGMVKSVTFTHVFVELHATQKIISLKKDAVVEINDRAGQLPSTTGGRVGLPPPTSSSAVPATPFIGAMTPAYPGSYTPGPSSYPMTPMMPGTPAYGAMTPMHGAGLGDRTPMYHASQTPLVPSQTPLLGPQTPLHPSAHDAYPGARTPSLPGTLSHHGGTAVAADEVPWYAPGVYVSVSVGMHAGKTGVIQSVQGGGHLCNVLFDAGPGAPVAVPTGDLRPRLPKDHENCRFLKGQYAGVVGYVLTSDGVEFVCRLGSATEEVDVMTADALVACAPPK